MLKSTTAMTEDVITTVLRRGPDFRAEWRRVFVPDTAGSTIWA